MALAESSQVVPMWLMIARQDIGLREIPGAQTAPKIRQMLADLKAWWTDDETPWCGVACASWFKRAGLALPKHWYRAKGWLEWGYPLKTPLLGCVVVFERAGGGHVGLCVGVDPRGFLMVLGGNQGDEVNTRAFDAARVLGYRWPYPASAGFLAQTLPRMDASGQVSTNEA